MLACCVVYAALGSFLLDFWLTKICALELYFGEITKLAIPQPTSANPTLQRINAQICLRQS